MDLWKFNEYRKEERESLDAGAFRGRSTPGQELTGSTRGSLIIEPACTKETNRRRAQTGGKQGKGSPVDHGPKEPRGMGAF